MNFKRILIWLVVLTFMVSSVLISVSCKGEASPTEEAVEEATPAGETEEEATPTEETTEPVSFEGAQIRVAMINEPREWLFEELLPEFKEMTGIDVVIDFYGFDDLFNKTLMASVGRTGEYDVYQFHFPDMALFDARGYMLDVTDWIERDWDEMQMDDIQKSIQESHMMYEGRYYGVPTHVGSHEFYYRKDIFEKEGYTLPETYADVIELAKDIDAKYGPDIRGFVYQSDSGVQGCGTYMGFLGSYGGDFFDNYTHLKPAMDSPEALQALNGLLEIKEYSVEGAVTYGFDECGTAFAQGKAAMTTFWDSGDFRFSDPEQSDIVGLWDVAPYPGGRATNGGWSVQISADSKQSEAAWEFLKWIISPDIEKKAIPLTPSCRTSILTDPENSEHPSYEGFNYILSQNPFGFPKVLPNWQILISTGTMVSSVLTEQVTPEEGLATLQKEMEVMMLRYDLWDGIK